MEGVQADATARSGEAEARARLRLDRESDAGEGVLAGEAALDLDVWGGPSGVVAVPLPGGELALGTRRDAAFTVEGRYHLPLTAGGLREAIARASLEGEARVTAPLDLARVELPQLLAAVVGPVEIALRARGTRQAEGEAEAGVEVELVEGTGGLELRWGRIAVETRDGVVRLDAPSGRTARGETGGLIPLLDAAVEGRLQ